MEKQMVKHIILWKLKDELSQNEKETVKKNAKHELEGLVGKVPGLLVMNIQTECLPSSNADMMLYSELEGCEYLEIYKNHPEHVRVADNFVRPFTVQRLCIDFES
jgi:hypothetical protein